MSTDSDRPISDAPGYGQLCAVGFALDAIGDRWTLLVLRDLARSPLRFRDLQAINPGMSPNLLTLRLRKLEAAGLVERRAAPYGGTGNLYALSNETRATVLPVLTATAELGAFLIDRLPRDDLAAMDLPQVLTRQMQLNGHFVNARSSELTGSFVLDMAGIPTYIRIGPTTFVANAEPQDDEPDATLAFFPPTILMRLMGQVMTIDEAEEAGFLTITGDREGALELVRLLSFS